MNSEQTNRNWTLNPEQMKEFFVYSDRTKHMYPTVPSGSLPQIPQIQGEEENLHSTCANTSATHQSMEQSR